jgi:hypothetical protein
MPEKNRFPAVLTPVVIDRAAFNQGENAQYEPHIGESEVMDSLVARGPHAVGVPFRKSKRACSTTDNETWVPADASNTLNNFDLGDTRKTHAVVQHQMPGSVAPTIGASGPPYSRTGNERVEAEALAITFTPHIVQASELRLRGQITEQNTCPTLLANTKSGDNDPLAVQAITFQPGNLRREAGADPSFTTTTTLKASAGDQTPHVACFKSGQGSQARSIGWSEELSPTLPSNAGGNTAPAVIGLNPPMAVRRLTPVECERLQGFPDNWSRISWKGKPEEDCPDGPRYKACGNSMAVPVMRWIGERIASVDLTFSTHA